MAVDPQALASFVRSRLHAAADPERVAPMQRYLKTEQPFFGVQRPAIRPIQREAIRAFSPDGPADWEAGVRALWAGPERELQYVAIAYGRGFAKRGFLTPAAVPLIAELVRSGAWWDLVDELASHCVGAIVLNHREAMRPILQAWITDPDVWIRRTAILAQLRHKEHTDTEMLFRFCLERAHETSFWIRKAIGWALRQYARTDPDAVRAFLAEYSDALSGLSRREASKHL